MENIERIVGFTCSTFDLLHAGHIAMLREAKEQCDYLICGLQTDPSIDRPEKNKPAQTLVERYTQLQAVRYVDEIIPYTTEQDLEDILKMLNIDVRIIGGSKFSYLAKDKFMSLDDIPGWHKKSYTVKNQTYQTATQYKDTYRDSYVVTIELERKAGYYIFKVIFL